MLAALASSPAHIDSAPNNGVGPNNRVYVIFSLLLLGKFWKKFPKNSKHVYTTTRGTRVINHIKSPYDLVR